MSNFVDIEAKLTEILMYYKSYLFLDTLYIENLKIYWTKSTRPKLQKANSPKKSIEPNLLKQKSKVTRLIRFN